MNPTLVLSAFFLSFAFLGVAQPTSPVVKVVRRFEGFDRPTHIAAAGDMSGRLFIVEQPGVIRIIKNGQTLPVPFLDIQDRVTLIDAFCCDERGLFSIAFPPGYQQKGHFYVSYTDREGSNTISRFRVTEDPDVADPASETILLSVLHTQTNHNGGQIAFSPIDGWLYIGLGDGGGSGDPFKAGQDPSTPLAKLLRIDVENGGTTPENRAMGLRNPWRFSFDRVTGDLYLGDVGQDTYEEVNFWPSDAGRVANFGWRVLEGPNCFEADECPLDDLTLPVAGYTHEEGCSVTGGHVYRGSRYPQVDGTYFYADFCMGSLWALNWREGNWISTKVLETGLNISTFGEDESGEIYLTDYLTGGIYELVVEP
jgi:glucose/arabinose dehydrogenase